MPLRPSNNNNSNSANSVTSIENSANAISTSEGRKGVSSANVNKSLSAPLPANTGYTQFPLSSSSMVVGDLD